jgi:outer membrane protein assembly factor BamE (lipoprotein component of BamABCDE complex)
MAGRNLLISLTGLGLLAAGCGCAAPAVQQADQGRRIDREVLEGFTRGVTTRAEVLQALGSPTSQKANPGDGSTTLAWSYVHVDQAASTTILTLIQFDADDRLLLKAMSQETKTH